MKKIGVLFFAAAMMLSIVFIGDALSSNGTLSVNAQTVSVKKHRRHGTVHRIYRGGRYVGYKVYRGGRWVVVKTYRGGKKGYRMTKNGSKKGYRMTKNASKKTYHKIHRAVQ